MKSIKNIIIPMETSSREMAYKIYLCNLLAINGFNCFLGKKTEIYFLIDKLSPFIYLDKGYHKGSSEKIYDKIFSNNGYIISLDEEGAVAYPDGRPLNLRYTQTLFNVSKMTFFWGKIQKETFKHLIPKDNIGIVSGHPRFQMLKRKYWYIYNDDVEVIKNKYNKFILINTNFARANNIRGVEAARANYISRYTDIDARINNDKIKLKIFTSLIKKLTDIGHNIVIRPHPEESIQTYLNIFRSYKNVYTTNERSVIPWIIASEILIHSDCTTGVESLMLGKKSISYVVDELEKSVLTILPQKASYIFDNENDILDFIENKSYKEKVDLKEISWIESNFNFSKDSFKLITENIKKLKFYKL